MSSPMKLIALDDRVIIHIAVKPEVVSDGGIHLPGGNDEYMEYGTVVELGEKVNKDETYAPTPGRAIAVGDVVIVQKIAAPELVYQGKRAKILRASNVLAIVEGYSPPPNPQPE